jgi:hypothetical protein
LSFAAQIAFHHVIRVDGLANFNDIGIAQFIHATLRGIPTFSQISWAFFANAVNIGQGNHHALGRRNVYTSYTSHLLLLFAVPGAAEPYKKPAILRFLPIFEVRLSEARII